MLLENWLKQSWKCSTTVQILWKGHKTWKKKSHLISTTLNNVKTTWKILSKFCGLLTISELYEECELRKDFTPLSVSSMMQWLNDFFFAPLFLANVQDCKVLPSYMYLAEWKYQMSNLRAFTQNVLEQFIQGQSINFQERNLKDLLIQSVFN